MSDGSTNPLPAERAPGDGAADARRVAAIDGYGALAGPPGRDLQALVELAAQVCQVPTAAINLIGDLEQHQLATVGFEPGICAREDSMCNAVLRTSGPVVVPDARLDERFAANPFVTGQIGLVRFYAASRLVTAAGVPIGTLCVFDTAPRTMSTEQYDALATLADRVVDVLELRLRTSQLERSLADLTATRDELHRSNRQLAGFVGQVSHDLRTPLTGVLGFVEELAELPVVTGDAQARWMAQRALASGERMRDMVEELLTYAQVGGSLRLAPVDLGEVATDVLHDLETVLRDAGAVVRVDRLPVVHGDAVQLRALLQNLIANAAKFRRAGVAPRIVLSHGAWATRGRSRCPTTGQGSHPTSASGCSSSWPAARGWPPRAAASAWPPASASSRPTAARSACTTPRTVGRACGSRCRWWTDGDGDGGRPGGSTPPRGPLRRVPAPGRRGSPAPPGPGSPAASGSGRRTAARPPGPRRRR